MGSEAVPRGALQAADLYSLEEYHRARPDFRARVLAHKALRQIAVGPNATLYFEDRLTIQYQVQEMLRIERIFEAEAIAEELAAYKPIAREKLRPWEFGTGLAVRDWLASRPCS